METNTYLLGRIQLRSGNALDLSTRNEILLPGEVCIESFNKIKIGNGVSNYNSLPYFIGDLLEGTNYLYVKGSRTPELNMEEFLEAYNALKSRPRFLGTLSGAAWSTIYKDQTYNVSGVPGYFKATVDYTGHAQSSTGDYALEITELEAKDNKQILIVGPGSYKYSTVLKLDASGIDVVSLTGLPDVNFIGDPAVILGNVNPGRINTFLGLKGDLLFSGGEICPIGVTFINCLGGNMSYFHSGNAGGKFINCKGGLTSFGSSGIASGYFKDCTGGNFSFGYSGVASGTFINCTGSDYSFGCEGIASGKFTDCVGGHGSFGGYLMLSGTASGTFNNCVGLSYSFGGRGLSSGDFNNCIGGYRSFGGAQGWASGNFNQCKGEDDSFGADGTADGNFKDCIGSDNSFGGGQGTASGNFTRCKGDLNAFGSSSIGTFIECEGGDYSFGSQDVSSGSFTRCIGGNYSFGYLTSASGNFTDCTGGNYSFGCQGTADGRFYGCKSGTHSFGHAGVASGTFNNCIGRDLSFASLGWASGNFTDCTGGVNAFGGHGVASGIFIRCTGGGSSFGGEGLSSGDFTECSGGYYSFGIGGTTSGTYSYCHFPGSSSFPTLKASIGRVASINSIGNNYAVNDIVSLIGTTPSGVAQIKITKVNNTGGVVEATPVLNYSVGCTATGVSTNTTGGSGTGFSPVVEWRKGRLIFCSNPTTVTSDTKF